jgi:ribonuclease HI
MHINKQKLEQSLVIFSDGSSLGNPGPGGYGALIISSKLGEVIELGGSKQTTTNNEMELVAIVSALTYVAYNQEKVHIFTDSSYVINGATSWMYGWKAKGWRKKDGEEVKNRFHWETLYSLIEDRGNDSINWHHVPGHVGIAGNERVDDIAREFAQGIDVELYRGTKDQYPITDILNITIEDSLKEQKSHKKAKAHSYLSVVDGVLKRHKTWSETEQRVKGVKAKFKKAISVDHEQEILKEWGYTEADIEG